MYVCEYVPVFHLDIVYLGEASDVQVHYDQRSIIYNIYLSILYFTIKDHVNVLLFYFMSDKCVTI